jgi:nucleotide-binding universal stress UspA family protein
LGTEFSLATGRGRPFDTRALEGQLRHEVARARRALEAAAGRRRIRSTFRVARGRVAAELLAAAEAADLLILGTASHAVGFRFRPGRVALAAAERSPRSVLLLRGGMRFEGRPLACYDGTAGADKALDAAAALARFTGNDVHVLIGEPDAKKAGALREAAAQRLAGSGVAVLFEDAPAATLDSMCRLIARTDADILVLAADDPRLGGEGCGRLLERVACPVLLVR